MTKLEFNIDRDGNQSLSGLTFERQQFHDLELSPPVGRSILIENCEFLDCSTSPGTCVIDSAVSLDRVIFSNFACGDAVRISAGASLSEVVITGKRPSSLIVRPEIDADFVLPEPRQTTFQLDISGFKGKVTIMGLRGSMVRRDSTRHVAVHANWKEEVDWKRLGIGPFSYWRIVVQKLVLSNVAEGVFSLPKTSHRDFAETMREKVQLEKSGLQIV